VVSGVIEDLDLLLARFKDLMAGPAQEYLELCRGTMDDKAVERAIDVFADPEKREAFFRFIKQIETLYEILSPSPDLRDHIEDFACLALLHQIVRNAFRKQAPLYGEMARKTEVLVRERVESLGLDTSLPAVPLDEQTLAVIRATGGTDNGKIINLVASIRKAVQEQGGDQPYLRPIGDRAEAILDAYSLRQETTEAALKKIEALVLEAVEAREQQRRMGMEAATFAFYWELKREDIPHPERTAEMVRLLVDRFPHHRENAAEFRQLKAELYRVLLPLAGKDRMVALADRLLGIR
jgi:type I restriction enzyme R subunit